MTTEATSMARMALSSSDGDRSIKDLAQTITRVECGRPAAPSDPRTPRRLDTPSRGGVAGRAGPRHNNLISCDRFREALRGAHEIDGHRCRCLRLAFGAARSACGDR